MPKLFNTPPEQIEFKVIKENNRFSIYYYKDGDWIWLGKRKIYYGAIYYMEAKLSELCYETPYSYDDLRGVELQYLLRSPTKQALMRGLINPNLLKPGSTVSIFENDKWKDLAKPKHTNIIYADYAEEWKKHDKELRLEEHISVDIVFSYLITTRYESRNTDS